VSQENGAARSGGEQVRQLILETTIDLVFEGRGFASVCVESIAARAGVAKTTIYRRWAEQGGGGHGRLHDAGRLRDALSRPRGRRRIGSGCRCTRWRRCSWARTGALVRGAPRGGPVRPRAGLGVSASAGRCRGGAMGRRPSSREAIERGGVCGGRSIRRPPSTCSYAPLYYPPADGDRRPVRGLYRGTVRNTG